MNRPGAVPRYSVEAANRANAGTNTIAGIVFAGVGGGLWGYLRLQLPREAFDFHDARHFSPITVFPWVFALIGAWFLLRALFDALRLGKFGNSLLECDGLFVLGRTTNAVVRTSRDLRSDYTLRLSCIRRIPVSVGPRHSEYQDRTLWEATRKVEGATIDSSVGIPVEFEIPADQPPADWPPPTSDATTPGVRWVLEVTAPAPGLNYESIFRVNVQHEKTARKLMEAEDREREAR